MLVAKNDCENDANLNNLTKLYEFNLANKYYGEKIEYKWNSDLIEQQNELLTKHSRRFSIDLTPNLFYSNSKLIDLLIKSDVSKYCEFKLIKRLLTFKETEINNETSSIQSSSFGSNSGGGDGAIMLEQVPTSRSDIFKATNLTMIEKRLLMKFINSVINEEKEAEEDVLTTSVTFNDLLNKHNLTKRLSNYILNAIAMCSPSVNYKEGVYKCKMYMKSVGRYGDSPFLYQMYGIGELTQAFSRLSAVFGTIYYLNLKTNSIKYDDSSEKNDNKRFVEGIYVDLKSSNQQQNEKFFKCKHLIVNFNYLNYEIDNMSSNRHDISKCILITNKSLFNVNANEEGKNDNNEASY